MTTPGAAYSTDNSRSGVYQEMCGNLQNELTNTKGRESLSRSGGLYRLARTSITDIR